MHVHTRPCFYWVKGEILNSAYKDSSERHLKLGWPFLHYCACNERREEKGRVFRCVLRSVAKGSAFYLMLHCCFAGVQRWRTRQHTIQLLKNIVKVKQSLVRGESQGGECSTLRNSYREQKRPILTGLSEGKTAKPTTDGIGIPEERDSGDKKPFEETDEEVKG